MRKVLMLSYYFPPLGLAGSVRITKFIKYLRQFNYEPIVLCTKKISYYFHDQDLINEIPETKIYRSSSLDPARIMYFIRGDSEPLSSKITKPSIFLHSFFFPDAKIFWVPFAYQYAGKIIKKEKPDLIFATSPPYSSLVLGLLLRRKYQLPLIAEFRDPWPMSIYDPNLIQKIMIKKFQRYLHANADCLLSISKEVSEDLEFDTELLEHGYDPNDFDVEASTELDVVHIGTTFGHEKEMLEFLDVVKELGIQFYVTGNITPAIINRISDINNCHWLGLLPHKKTMQLISKAKLLIYFYPAKKAYTTSRFHEYLGAGKPILAISKHIDHMEFSIEGRKIGITVPDDKHIIKSGICEMLSGNTLFTYVASNENSFIDLTKKLANTFDNVLARNKR